MLGTLRRRAHSERGVSAVEFSIIAPVLLLLIFTIIYAALWLYGRNTALTAAREGVSYLRLAGSNSDPDSFRANAERLAEDYAVELGGLDRVTTDSEIDVDTGRVRVEVEGYMDLPLGEVKVLQYAEGTLEQFRGDPEV